MRRKARQVNGKDERKGIEGERRKGRRTEEKNRKKEVK